MTDTTQHDPKEELARLREQVVAQQARIDVFKTAFIAYLGMGLPESFKQTFRTVLNTDNLFALKAHDDALWNEALTTGIEWQATRGHTLDADDYGNELRSLKR